MQEDSPSMLSTIQTAAVMDNAPIAVFVSASDNRELLYLNRLAKEFVSTMPSEQRRTCYQVAGFQKPCPFCSAGKMNRTELFTRQYRHPVNQRVYQVSGKLIEWDGRPAQIEYISDITEAQAKEIQTKALSEELQTTFSSIPCGLCVYRYDGQRIYPVFHNHVFYEVMGYSEEHIHSVEQETDYLGVHPDDVAALEGIIQEAICKNSILHHVYRVWNDKKQQYSWIRLEGSVKPQEDGTKLLYGVYSDVSSQYRMEEYFQTVVRHLPGGVAVVRYGKDGRMATEFLSEGLAAMTGMTMEEAWETYRSDVMAGIHPDDLEMVKKQMADFIAGGRSQCEILYRLKKGNGCYLWVKNTLSVIQSGNGEYRLYTSFHDVTRDQEIQEQLRRQYKELILQHYRTMDPNALVVGHCNVTKNQIYEIIDHTDSDLLRTFGTVRETFFTGLSSLVVEGGERREFLNRYLNAPALAAFERGDTEQIMNCFMKLPKEQAGRYVQFKMSLVETPDTRDITGILTVTDVTEQVISERILKQLSVVSYDLVADVDLKNDHFTLLNGTLECGDIAADEGRHSHRIAYMLKNQVVPKDREQVARMLDPAYITERLERDGSYSFPYSIVGESGDILTKNLTVSAVDLRLGRICLARTDITESVREEQGLLNVVAYTFELLAFIKTDTSHLTLHTRQTVLENLPPFVIENYDRAVKSFTKDFVQNKDRESIEKQFRMETMLKKLEDSPSGYDFVLPWKGDTGLRYKQVNVLWGDSGHKTICLVRADVTDMLAAERRTKEALEKALAQAEEANQAKSDFLSSMSHDIRTPMNAIMGMTALASAHLDNREKLENCLRKISFSSRHLLSLINDILDMSKIERSKITLNHTKIVLSKLMGQLADMMIPQAEAAGLELTFLEKGIHHPGFYGDSLRINQIMINILGNAIKFTPEGGRVEFTAEEIPPKKDLGNARYRFAIRDTGVGMEEAFLTHIFEPFTRSRNAASVEGTGLGLSITKGLVDLMEGTIAVESRVGEGTVFLVELEGEAAAAGESTAEMEETETVNEEAEKLLEGRRFLIAEDNAINSEILCELLNMCGAQSVVKTDGFQAVEAFCTALPGTYDAV
ncbi:ATP-binding protein [Clostridium sp. AM58-1XD]|uniref:ATP-binding protein n=1 Tax=Clostridium sp. AM58-1XD TaxID=2292307 RepID=UPI00325BD8D0